MRQVRLGVGRLSWHFDVGLGAGDCPTVSRKFWQVAHLAATAGRLGHTAAAIASCHSGLVEPCRRVGPSGEAQ